MEERVLFKTEKQREFLKLVKARLKCVSIRSLLQFGIKTSYSSLKNYYSERRLMGRDLFEDLCYLAKINPDNLDVVYLKASWGQVKGGKIGKRKKFK